MSRCRCFTNATARYRPLTLLGALLFKIDLVRQFGVMLVSWVALLLDFSSIWLVKWRLPEKWSVLRVGGSSTWRPASLRWRLWHFLLNPIRVISVGNLLSVLTLGSIICANFLQRESFKFALKKPKSSWPLVRCWFQLWRFLSHPVDRLLTLNFTDFLKTNSSISSNLTNLKNQIISVNIFKWKPPCKIVNFNTFLLNENPISKLN